MKTYIALLRAVNVGGTGKLPMTKLVEFCEKAGFAQARTYIASGNVVFRAEGTEEHVRAALEKPLAKFAGKPVGVIVRSAAEFADVVKRNPFSAHPGNRVMALFVDGKLPRDVMDGVTGGKDEELRLGKHEFFIYYPTGMGDSRLRIPSQKIGTARNMNTVGKLAQMAAELGS